MCLTANCALDMCFFWFFLVIYMNIKLKSAQKAPLYYIDITKYNSRKPRNTYPKTDVLLNQFIHLFKHLNSFVLNGIFVWLVRCILCMHCIQK